jgi:hypothetical protein
MIFIDQTWPKCGLHATLQLIFAALGPFSVMRKSNIDLPAIWSKTVNKSIKRTKKISAPQKSNFIK